MPLEHIDLDWKKVAIPADVDEFLRAADEVVDSYYEHRKGRSHGGFLPSDYRGVYRLLSVLASGPHLLGRRFCEWGSGCGVVTCLAAYLDYDAFGVEIAPDLVNSSEKLAREFNLDARFVCGTYVPVGYDSGVDAIAGSRQLIRTGAPATESSWELRTGLSMDDIDVVYMFPWPGEARFMEKLFDATATEGALLVCYHEDGDFSVRRRVVEEEYDRDEDDPDPLDLLD